MKYTSKAYTSFHINTRNLTFIPLLCLFPLSSAASMWTMARRRDAALWTPWPALGQDSSCRPTLCTASGGSLSSTARTATMSCPPSPCPGTPPSPVTCEYYTDKPERLAEGASVLGKKIFSTVPDEFGEYICLCVCACVSVCMHAHVCLCVCGEAELTLPVFQHRTLLVLVISI